MAQTIWKYRLRYTDQSQVLMVPPGAQLLSVGEQLLDGSHYELVLWAQVDPDRRPTAPRCISIITTGEKMPDRILRFIGTVNRYNGDVCHIFEG